MVPRRPYTRLRTRILAWSFVPTTIILLAVAVTIYFAYQRVTQDLVVGRNQQLVRLSAGELSANLGTYVSTLSSLTRTPDLYAQDPDLQSIALRQASNQLLIFDGGTIILDRFGRVVTGQPDHPGLAGQDWSSRSFFRQILRTGQPAFSDTLAASWLDSPVIGVAVPIMNADGEFRGTLVGMFRLGASSASAFYGGIVKLRLGGNGSTYLVDGSGRVIYHPDESRIGTDLHTQPQVVQVLNGGVGYLRTRGLDNRDILATYAPVPGTPWGLINEEDWAELLAASQGYGQFLSVLLGLGLVLPVVLALLGVKRITDPIAQFISAAREIAGGKYGQQVTVNTGDELEELGNQFNQMSVQLSESYSQLEQRVLARTRELATLNAIAAVASGSLNLEEILNNALEKILQVLGMEWGCAYAIDDEGATLRLLAQHGLPQDFADRISPRPLKGSVVEEAALTGHPRVWQIDEYPEVLLRPLLEREGIDHIIGVPLMVKGRLVGAFMFGALSARPVSADALSLLDASGQQIGIAVENARLYRQAEETAAMAERTRLARELHDSVTQSLYSVTLFAQASARLIAMDDYASAAENLHELRDTAQEALQEMRLLIFELRPSALEHHGLASALQARLDAVERRGGVRGELHVDGEDHLSPLMQAELYHIAQEALNNTLKHAHAQRVDIYLSFSETRVQLQVCDDGVGFDAASLGRGGQGLAGMRERAQRIHGELLIDSKVGGGSTVTAIAPLNSPTGMPALQEGDRR
jgi:nitrate/nitrite-specific signal transduction histidine kinase